MQTTFEALLNADNATRQQAETAIQRQYETGPMELAKQLVECLSGAPEVATMCCVLIKKYFLDQRAATKLGQADLEGLLSAMMTSIQSNIEGQSLHLLKNKGDVLTRVYLQLNKSVELLSTMASLMENSEAKVRQFAMYCFEVLSELSMDQEQLATMSNDFKTVFEKGLQDADNNVRVASLRAVTSFLSTIQDQDVVFKFVSTLDLIMKIIVEALKVDEESGRVGLEALGELTNAHPEVWKNPAQLLEVTSEVMKHSGFQEGTRSAAIEVLLALSSNMPAVLRKSEQMKTNVLPALAMMLMEVEQDTAAWEESEEDRDMFGKDPATSAMRALQEMTADLGAKTTVSFTEHIISELLQSNEWQKQQAGFVFLGAISPATRENEQYIKEKMNLFLNLSSDNKRIQYAALLALGFIFKEWAPMVQKNYADKFVPMLVTRMTQETSKKMLTQVTSVLLNFVQGLAEDGAGTKHEESFTHLIKPFAKELLQGLVHVMKVGIQQKYESLTIETLNLLHSMCQVLLADFGQYFNDFMPMMKEILQNVQGSAMEDKKLRAKAIDTIGSITIAVTECKDKSPFAAGIKEITEMLAQALNAGFSDDDPQEEAIKSALTESAAFLQQDFAPYMQFLTQTLLKDAALEIDLKVENADMPTANQEEGYKVKVQGLGEQRITVNTSNLVKKTAAFSLIERIAESMGSAFGPYIAQVLPIVRQHMKFEHSHQIRKFALKTFKHVLVAIGEDNNIAMFQEELATYINCITEGFAKLDKKVVKTYLKYFAETLKALNRANENKREFLNDEQINALGPLIKRCLELVTALKQATIRTVEKKAQSQEIDAEDILNIKNTEFEPIAKISTQVMELTGQLCEIFKNRAFPVVKENALEFFGKQLESFKALTDDELLATLCFFCDYIENTDARLDAGFVNQVGAKFLEIACHDEENIEDHIMQTICYGFGVFAYNLPNGEFKILAKAVEKCKSFLQAEDAFSEDRIIATESTMGALARIAYMHLDNKVIGNGELNMILSKMPFTAYEDENKNSHRILIEQFMTQTSHVHNSSVLPNAVATLKRIRDYTGDEKILFAANKQQLAELKL